MLLNSIIFLFQRARNQFRNLLGKSTQKLKASYDKLGKCVGKVRPYYVLLTESKEVILDATENYRS